jgi:hypothetical protein
LSSINIPTGVTTIDRVSFYGCSSLPSIYIPSSVSFAGSNAFLGCSSLSIDCQASSQPSGWESDWNPDSRPVTWNYTP